MTAIEPISSETTFYVEMRNLTLARGERVLIDNLSLTLSSGSLVYVTGENGIGKSTLLLSLAGLLKPEIGQIDYAGDAHPFNCAALLSQPDGSSRGFTAAEDLKFFLNLQSLSIDIDDLLRRTGLSAAASVMVEGLSLGQKKRLGLAKIMASQRPLWLLDEPFSALDVQGRAFVTQTLSDHIKAGGIAVVATHSPIPLQGVQTKTLHLSSEMT
ncbi:heme exporter protein A [Litorimonas taeanensis]|uniref:Heme exporter protein A n=1 Tax=Litorimonas taeanensis TaxID=568099 RepID=A0A420WJA3_9PROT|nr:heme ABC exporter ATP-binding protein CcmA [Litorimonas taeanensis]RKQ71087.1 heme exporter protein A [Litorimonas taeanensis]